MRFEISHRFGPVNLESFVDLYFSDEVTRAANKSSGMKSRKVVEEVPDGAGGFSRTVEMVPGGLFPKTVARLFGQRSLVLVEKSTFDASQSRLDFTLGGPWGGALVVTGAVTFIEDGDGIIRKLVADVEGQVGGLSGTVERRMLKKMQKTYDKNAVILKKAVAKRR
jgi:hypothetical protein